MPTHARPRRFDEAPDLIDAYLHDLRSRGRADATIYQYEQTLRHWHGWLGQRPVRDATVDHVRAFLSRGRVRQARDALGAPATIKRDLVALRGFYGFCLTVPHRSGVRCSPCEHVEAPTVRNRNPKAIERQLWRRVWFADSLDDSERVMLGLGFFCGFRREEIVALRREHVDWLTLRFGGFPRKGGGDDVFPFGSALALWGERVPELIGTPDLFLDALFRVATRERGRGFVLPWGDYGVRYLRRRPLPAGQAHVNQVNKKLRRLLARVGEIERAFTPHALRHSFVTYLLDAGVPLHEVSSLANHSDVSVTMRYVKVATDPLAKYHGGLSWSPPT